MVGIVSRAAAPADFWIKLLLFIGYLRFGIIFEFVKIRNFHEKPSLLTPHSSHLTPDA
jgi:hypothetical protein